MKLVILILLIEICGKIIKKANSSRSLKRFTHRLERITQYFYYFEWQVLMEIKFFSFYSFSFET